MIFRATVPCDLARLRLWSRDDHGQARERLAAYRRQAAPLTGGSGDFHHLAVPLFEQTHGRSR
jgi:hypothetical protein